MSLSASDVLLRGRMTPSLINKLVYSLDTRTGNTLVNGLSQIVILDISVDSERMLGSAKGEATVPFRLTARSDP